MYFILVCIFALAFAGVFFWMVFQGRHIDAPSTQPLNTLATCHKTGQALLNLVAEDGAGIWPPKSDHINWPTALRPFHNIYLELLPLLSTSEPSLDDDANIERRTRYRSLMARLLSERINLSEVEKILSTAEAGNWDDCPRDAYNGFYCCIAVSRHAYRYDNA
jgi:hypothetical protein